MDAATQKGKTRATKADIGEAPVVKLTASGKLARIREILDEAHEAHEAHEANEAEEQSDAGSAPWDVSLRFDLAEYKELLNLVGL